MGLRDPGASAFPFPLRTTPPIRGQQEESEAVGARATGAPGALRFPRVFTRSSRVRSQGVRKGAASHIFPLVLFH